MVAALGADNPRERLLPGIGFASLHSAPMLSSATTIVLALAFALQPLTAALCAERCERDSLPDTESRPAVVPSRAVRGYGDRLRKEEQSMTSTSARTRTAALACAITAVAASSSLMADDPAPTQAQA